MRSKRKLIILLSFCPFFCLPQANKHVTLLSSCFQVCILFRISFFDANVIIVSRLFWFLLATKFDSSSIVLMESIRSLGTLSFDTVHGVAFFSSQQLKYVYPVCVWVCMCARVFVWVYVCISVSVSMSVYCLINSLSASSNIHFLLLFVNFLVSSAHFSFYQMTQM